MKVFCKRWLCRALCLALCACLALGAVGCASRGVSTDSASQPDIPPVDQTDTPAPALPETPADCDPLTGAAPGGVMTTGRPVAVMIDNIRAALPQSGIAAASVVYEMVTEGGIPRMMAVYPSAQALGKVGPVRSVRDQFVQVLAPMNGILLHIGSSIYASDMLRALEYPTVDGIYLGTVVFAFDETRAAQRDNSHCFYTNAELAAAGIERQGLTGGGPIAPLFHFVPYDQPARVPETRAAGRVDFAFSQEAAVTLQYNAETARYYKSEYGDPQMDEATGEQLSYTNLLLLGCTVDLKSDGLCTDFVLTQGEGYYFSQGSCQPVRWHKGEVTTPLTLYDTDGVELTVNVGNTYVALVDSRALEMTLAVDGANLAATEAAEAAAAENGGEGAEGENGESNSESAGSESAAG